MPILKRVFPFGLALLLAFPVLADDKEAARDELRAMRKDTLAQLYQESPAAKKEVRAAAGYGVFGVFGAQVLLLGGSGGRGIVRHNLTGRDTYMRVGSVSAGLGLGFQDQRTVLIFKHRDILKKFLDEGWVFSGEAAAVAKQNGQGDSANDMASLYGIKVYQLTKNGLIAQGTVQGTKYWKDDELN
jgi:lipid-binding SYLF domain-containing protein